MGDTEKLETIRYQYFMILTISALYRFIFDMTQLTLPINNSQLTLMLLITCYNTYLLKKNTLTFAGVSLLYLADTTSPAVLNSLPEASY